jgi:hypothetical protein
MFTHLFIFPPDPPEQPDHFKLVHKTKYERKSERLGIIYSKKVEEKRLVGRPNAMNITLYNLKVQKSEQSNKQRKRWQRLLINTKNKKKLGIRSYILTKTPVYSKTKPSTEKIQYISSYHKKIFVDNETRYYNGESSRRI